MRAGAVRTAGRAARGIRVPRCRSPWWHAGGFPGARIDLPAGGTGGTGAANHLDITRIRQDTGYEPAYGTEAAVADHLAWLRAGHER
jgi:nucleoside-diphosphate-sugar epimerase